MDMSIYCTDDYPRVGCVAAVDVTKDGYRLSICAPNGAPMESYRTVKDPADISRMLREWCEGKVPQVRAKADQS